MSKVFVLFDVDGTLVYSNKVDSESFAETYESIYKEPFPTIDWRKFPHVTDHTIFSTVIKEHFGRAINAEEIEQFQNAFVSLLQEKRGHSPEQFKAVPGSKAVIDRLLEEGYIVGIGTGGWKRPALLKLRHVGVNVDSLIVSAADNKVTREDILQDAVDQAIAKHGELSRIIYIGDAIWDITTTRNMDMNFIGLRLKGDVEVLQREGAEIVIQNYLDYDSFKKHLFVATPPKKIGDCNETKNL